jgi:lipid A ethanolaminephosphotransferase
MLIKINRANFIKFTSIQLILLVSLFIALADNQVFFYKLSERLNIFSPQGMGYIITIFILIFSLLVIVHLLFGSKYLLKTLMIFTLILSAVLSYFDSELGVIFDVDMIRNIVETIKDNNKQEAFELLSLPLVKHVFLYGILPSVFVILSKIMFRPFSKEVFIRMATFVGLLVLLGIFIFANYKYTTYFSRENRDLRLHIIPLHAFDSLKGYVRRELKKNIAPLKIIGDDAVQAKRGNGRIIGVMVVGETARGDHFSLNGYSRETNPHLKKHTIFNYPKTRSCGTSTAFSVPCMFSFLDRSEYSPEKAAGQSNSLDILEKAGVNVVWVDNNSSCKGVCERIGEINIRNKPDTHSPYYLNEEMLDESLVGELDKVLKSASKKSDILVVLHTMGSHGPKYYKRYPEAFSKFEPACKQASPQECTDKEIINAYDNTILYTDYVLHQLIQYLKLKQSDNNTFLFYASDHGESLGEKGVYLHGLPYFLAPIGQTHVPMINWFSQTYINNEKLDIKAMKTAQDISSSHDNLSYSLLDVFNVNTKINKPNHSLILRNKQ